MTFADWMTETRSRYREQPLTAATVTSARKFWDGAKARFTLMKTKRRGWLRTSLVGEEVEFRATSATDVKRATTLNGENAVLEWLLEGVGSDTVVWDVGGYHGHYSVVAASKGATVVSFEPVAGNRARLIENVERNGLTSQVTVQGIALSHRDGKMRLAPDTSTSSISAGGTELVTTKRGDTVSPKPDAVKIDVEGHELAVLQGMVETLQTVDRVAVEVHEPELVNTVAEQLEQAGLSTSEFETDRTQAYVGGSR